MRVYCAPHTARRIQFSTSTPVTGIQCGVQVGFFLLNFPRQYKFSHGYTSCISTTDLIQKYSPHPLWRRLPSNRQRFEAKFPPPPPSAWSQCKGSQCSLHYPVKLYMMAFRDRRHCRVYVYMRQRPVIYVPHNYYRFTRTVVYCTS